MIAVVNSQLWLRYNARVILHGQNVNTQLFQCLLLSKKRQWHPTRSGEPAYAQFSGISLGLSVPVRKYRKNVNISRANLMYLFLCGESFSHPKIPMTKVEAKYMSHVYIFHYCQCCSHSLCQDSWRLTQLPQAPSPSSSRWRGTDPEPRLDAGLVGLRCVRAASLQPEPKFNE